MTPELPFDTVPETELETRGTAVDETTAHVVPFPPRGPVLFRIVLSPEALDRMCAQMVPATEIRWKPKWA